MEQWSKVERFLNGTEDADKLVAWSTTSGML